MPGPSGPPGGNELVERKFPFLGMRSTRFFADIRQIAFEEIPDIKEDLTPAQPFLGTYSLRGLNLFRVNQTNLGRVVVIFWLGRMLRRAGLPVSAIVIWGRPGDFGFGLSQSAPPETIRPHLRYLAAYAQARRIEIPRNGTAPSELASYLSDLRAAQSEMVEVLRSTLRGASPLIQEILWLPPYFRKPRLGYEMNGTRLGWIRAVGLRSVELGFHAGTRLRHVSERLDFSLPGPATLRFRRESDIDEAEVDRIVRAAAALP